MPRLNTEYIAKLQHAHFKRAKLNMDLAIFKDELQIRKALQKELDESE